MGHHEAPLIGALGGHLGAWYQVLAGVEGLSVKEESSCGGAADIHKFFDQVLRPMVYGLAIYIYAGIEHASVMTRTV